MYIRKIKYSLSAFITAIFVICLSVLPASAERTVNIPYFRIEFPLGDTGEIYSTAVWDPDIPQNNDLYITLPGFAKNNALAVIINETDEVLLDGTELENRRDITGLSEGVHTLEVNDEAFALTVFYTSDIPTLFINTESGSLDRILADKSYKEQGFAVIMDGETLEYRGPLEYIKGRGNDTWTYSKRPFNIKFESKVDLFGMGKAKKWALLANMNDPTDLKSKLRFGYADAVGLDFSPSATAADLYINGVYHGLYDVAENIETVDTRVAITDLEKATARVNPAADLEKLPLKGDRSDTSHLTKGSYKYVDIAADPQDITGGYLIECEIGTRYKKEISGFVSGYGQPITVKSPEYASKKQVEYIRDYYQQFEDAVLSDTGYNSRGKYYTDYIDLRSFAKAYVFNEFVKNLDTGITSCYFYKDRGGRLTAGPVWDFDSSFGRVFERNGVYMEDPEGYWATDGKLLGKGFEDKYTIFTLLCRHRDFRREAARQWQEYFRPQVESLLSQAEKMYGEAEDSLISDKTRWNKFSSENGLGAEEYCTQGYDRLTSFISRRAQWMNSRFDEKYFYVQYCANGGSGIMLDREVYLGTDRVYLPACSFAREGYTFSGWNTARDGSGTMYQPAETAPVNGQNVLLYAQWYRPTFWDKVKSVIIKFIN